jgi:hypothetical protein
MKPRMSDEAKNDIVFEERLLFISSRKKKGEAW